MSGLAKPVFYTLFDGLNDVTISRHFTAFSAAKAQRAHLAALRKRHGDGARLPYEIMRSDGVDVSEEVKQARIDADGE